MKLTLQKLLSMETGYTFLVGESEDIIKGRKTLWVARKEDKSGRWSIYYDIQDFQSNFRGSKVQDIEVVKKLIDCTDNAIKYYKK